MYNFLKHTIESYSIDIGEDTMFCHELPKFTNVKCYCRIY